MTACVFTVGDAMLAVGPRDADRADQVAQTAINIAGPGDTMVVLLRVFT